MESMAALGVNATMEGFGRGCEDDEVPIGTRTVNFSVPGDNSLLPFCEALQVWSPFAAGPSSGVSSTLPNLLKALQNSSVGGIVGHVLRARECLKLLSWEAQEPVRKEFAFQVAKRFHMHISGASGYAKAYAKTKR